MAENPADSLPKKREESESEKITSLSAKDQPPSTTDKEAQKKAKLAEIEARKQQKLKQKLEKSQKKGKKSSDSESVSEGRENVSESSGVHSPKIKSQKMIEEEDDDYAPSEEGSDSSELSLLSEEKDHGDMEDFNIEEYKKFLASEEKK